MGIFTQTMKPDTPVVQDDNAATENLASEEASLASSAETVTQGADVEASADPLAGAIDDPVTDPAGDPITEPAPAVEEPAVEPEPVVPEPEPPVDPVIDDGVVEPVEDQTVEPVPVVEEPVGVTMMAKRPASAKAYQLVNQIDQLRQYDRSVQALHTSLSQVQLVTSLSQIAKEHNLSAPLVAAFNAVPGFDVALENFPSQDLFNVIPEHAATPNNILGLEAFDTATTASVDTLTTKTDNLGAAFASVLAGLDVTVQNLMDQIHDDQEDLGNSDMTEEVMAILPVHTLSNESFLTLLTSVETHLRSIEVFSADDLRANPDKVQEEVAGVHALVDELGSVLGLGVGEYGLVDADKNAAYEPTPGSFGDKDISKAGLVFLLNKAADVLGVLKTIADRKEELVAGVTNEVTDMPAPLNSDDVMYGRVEHVTLMSCYTTLVTKLVREAVLAITMLLSTVDAVLDIDDGQDD